MTLKGSFEYDYDTKTFILDVHRDYYTDKKIKVTLCDERVSLTSDSGDIVIRDNIVEAYFKA